MNAPACPRQQVYPLEAFWDPHEPDEPASINDAMLPVLQAADVIFCRDATEQRPVIVSGHVLAAAIAGGATIDRPWRCVCVEVDADDPNQLLLLEVALTIAGKWAGG